jgi:hypothetical protein
MSVTKLESPGLVMWLGKKAYALFQETIRKEYEKYLKMECQHEKCTRRATVCNQQYFADKWLCTFHANKATKEGRIKRKLTKKPKVL